LDVMNLVNQGSSPIRRRLSRPSFEDFDPERSGPFVFRKSKLKSWAGTAQLNSER
jgi:hypothetical protein